MRENQSTDTGDEYIRLCVNILTPLPPITVNLGPQMLQSQYRCFADWLISLLHTFPPIFVFHLAAVQDSPWPI